MNCIIITGRLTRDPEVKFGASGKAYAKFYVAVDRTFKKGEVDFINCVAFGKTAELIGEYLKKGAKAGFQGSLQVNQYEKDGEKKQSYDIAVNQVEFLNTKSENNVKQVESDYVPTSDPVADTGNDDEFPF